MRIEKLIALKTAEAICKLYNTEIAVDLIAVKETVTLYKETGDFTIVVFPFVKISKKSPDITANEIGPYLLQEIAEIQSFSVIKGFLNLKIKDIYWISFLNSTDFNQYGFPTKRSNQKILVEYSSPNTNKPLHLGHIRNNLLGSSVAEILKANGNYVIQLNLINNRGIHICKSMLAWIKWGNGETPENTGLKGDQLVGKYYVLFDKHYKEEVKELTAKGISEEDASKKAPLILEAQEMLRKWEKNDPDILSLWNKMNQWVYTGFDETYRRLGIKFDQIQYESDTYLLGKQIVEKGVSENKLIKKEDGSVWADLTQEGLDEKLLLRADGTSVYMTQDIGTAQLRYDEHSPDKIVYVVGNEQNYHFDVLKRVLQKLGKNWADCIYHLSYGMVELPEGKMKSREGNVVDADDLITGMEKIAAQTTTELGKTSGMEEKEAEILFHQIGLGALKYFILKVDPKKNMMFNPNESIDFNGNTGPFIQYTHARIRSVLRKASETGIVWDNKQIPYQNLLEKEKETIKLLYSYPAIIKEAGDILSPAIIANYVYEVVKVFNSFYQDTPILKNEDENTTQFRLLLSENTSMVIKSAMKLLGIDVPEKM